METLEVFCSCKTAKWSCSVACWTYSSGVWSDLSYNGMDVELVSFGAKNMVVTQKRA